MHAFVVSPEHSHSTISSVAEQDEDVSSPMQSGCNGGGGGGGGDD